jgi:hypothetical protein
MCAGEVDVGRLGVGDAIEAEGFGAGDAIETERPRAGEIDDL